MEKTRRESLSNSLTRKDYEGAYTLFKEDEEVVFGLDEAALRGFYTNVYAKLGWKRAEDLAKVIFSNKMRQVFAERNKLFEYKGLVEDIICFEELYTETLLPSESERILHGDQIDFRGTILYLRSNGLKAKAEAIIRAKAGR